MALPIIMTAGCQSTSGVAVEVAIDAHCASAPIATLVVDVTAMPPLKQPISTVDASTLFGSTASGRIGLLLPAATTSAAITIRALDAAGNDVGDSEQALFTIHGASRQTASVTLSSGSCGLDGGAPLDGAAPDSAADQGSGGLDDLLDVDLPPSGPIVTSVESGGRFGSTIYEAEGTLETSGVGVAVLVKGSGFSSSLPVTSSYATLDSPLVNAEGTELAFAMHLPVDTALPVSSPFPVPISIGGVPAHVTIMGLNELVLKANTIRNQLVSGDLFMYSQVDLAGFQLGFEGTVPTFLYANGGIQNGTILVTNASGYPGCTATVCSAAVNGAGYGHSGISKIGGGGGAGYGSAGSKGAGANGGAAGVAFGAASLLGLLPGAGGGASGDGTAGGAGGGAVRIQGATLTQLTIEVNGAAGKMSANKLGSGGGSGGAVLLQSRGAITQVSIAAGGGFGGAGNTSAGGDGGDGRIRFDSATPQDPAIAASPVVSNNGAMLAEDFPVVWADPPLSVQVACGGGSHFQLLLDGVVASAKAACSGSGLTTLVVENLVTLTSSPARGKVSQLCVQNIDASAPAGTKPRYPAPHQEDRDCRSIVVLDP